MAAGLDGQVLDHSRDAIEKRLVGKTEYHAGDDGQARRLCEFVDGDDAQRALVVVRRQNSRSSGAEVIDHRGNLFERRDPRSA